MELLNIILVKGFTLIELMIVVAIIGILSAIAIPSYSNYITRAQVSESIKLGGALMTSLEDYGGENGQWPTAIVATAVNPSLTEIGGTIFGKYSIVTPTVTGVYPQGTITITMTHGKTSGDTILFVTSDGGATWNCNSGTVDIKYRPNACK